jgi:hypothetical protein
MTNSTCLIQNVCNMFSHRKMTTIFFSNYKVWKLWTYVHFTKVMFSNIQGYKPKCASQRSNKHHDECTETLFHGAFKEVQRKVLRFNRSCARHHQFSGCKFSWSFVLRMPWPANVHHGNEYIFTNLQAYDASKCQSSKCCNKSNYIRMPQLTRSFSMSSSIHH